MHIEDYFDLVLTEDYSVSYGGHTLVSGAVSPITTTS
jgi:hypothetical protein